MADRTLRGRLEFEYRGTAAERAERDVKSIGKAGGEAQKGIDKANKSSSDFNDTLKKLGLTIGAAAIVRGIYNFGKASIQAASDVEEMGSKFRVVFGEEAPRVEKELGNLADTINRSRFDLMEYAATLQDTFVPLGFARDAAADFSVEVVKLSEDLASFNNLRTEDVVRDIQSALVGNTETLRKYGVVANESAIQQEALSSGLVTDKKEIDANVKARAILNLTLKGTSDAQGDAERTADSFANVQKGLEAATKDLQVAIGEELMPSMTDFSNILTKVIDKATNYLKTHQELRKTQERFDRALDAGVITFEEYERSIRRGGKEVIGLGDSYERVLPKVEEWEKLLESNARDDRPRLAIRALRREFQEMVNPMRDAIIQWDDAADRLYFFSKLAKDAGQATDDYEVSIEELTTAQERQARAQEKADEALQEYIGHFRDVFRESRQADKETDLLVYSLDELGQHYYRVGGLTVDQKEALEDLQSAYDGAAKVIRDYNIGLRGFGMSEDEINEKIAEQQQLMDYLAPRIAELEGNTGTLTSKTNEFKFSTEELYDALYKELEQVGAAPEILVAAGVATGQFTEAQGRALLKVAAMRIKIEELAVKIAEGMSIPAALVLLQDFQDDLEGTATHSAPELTRAVDALASSSSVWVDKSPYRAQFDVDTAAAQAAIDSLPTTWVIHGIVDVDTRALNRQHGGPVFPSQPYIVGERGPELFVPSTAGQIVPNQQAFPGPLSSVVFERGAIVINAAAGVSEERIAAKVAQKVRLAALSGQGVTGR